jgi:imidazole glycerol phosphate synthase subunit HisF
VLTKGNADAALAASLFHDGKLRIPDLKKALLGWNIPIRVVEEV